MKLLIARFIFVGSLVALLFFALSHSSHLPLPVATAAPAPAEDPAAQMKRLANFYRGTWEYTEYYEKTPQFAQGGQNTGIYTSEPGPGGYSLLNRFHSQGPVGDFEGLMMMTWDPKENAYKGYVFGNSFPGCLTETGQFEGDTLVFHMEFSMGEKKISIRNATHMDEKGKLISEEYVGGANGQETLMIRVVATRKL
jgi:hypothetical protein